jgi:hypothetical protein
MHMRGTQYRDGVRFEEVSFGYPRDWNNARGLAHYLRQIFPAPSSKADAGGIDSDATNRIPT